MLHDNFYYEPYCQRKDQYNHTKKYEYPKNTYLKRGSFKSKYNKYKDYDQNKENDKNQANTYYKKDYFYKPSKKEPTDKYSTYQAINSTYRKENVNYNSNKRSFDKHSNHQKKIDESSSIKSSSSSSNSVREDSPESSKENIGEKENCSKNAYEKCNYIYYGPNAIFENTEILNINIKISKDKFAVFRLRRFDDLFQTVKLFCEIYKIKDELIKPIIIKVLSTLGNIYSIINCKIDEHDADYLMKIKENKFI